MAQPPGCPKNGDHLYLRLFITGDERPIVYVRSPGDFDRVYDLSTGRLSQFCYLAGSVGEPVEIRGPAGFSDDSRPSKTAIGVLVDHAGDSLTVAIVRPGLPEEGDCSIDELTVPWGRGDATLLDSSHYLAIAEGAPPWTGAMSVQLYDPTSGEWRDEIRLSLDSLIDKRFPGFSGGSVSKATESTSDMTINMLLELVDSAGKQSSGFARASEHSVEQSFVIGLQVEDFMIAESWLGRHVVFFGAQVASYLLRAEGIWIPVEWAHSEWSYTKVSRARLLRTGTYPNTQMPEYRSMAQGSALYMLSSDMRLLTFSIR